MDDSPLFKVVEDESDSHGGIDYGSRSLNSQSGDLISWGEDESPRRLVEITPPGKQGKESPLISEMREKEQQMRRQRDEARQYCGDILRAMQQLQVDQVAVSTGSRRARHSYLPQAADESGPRRARASSVDKLGSSRAGACNFENSQLENKGRLKSAHVQAGSGSEGSSNELEKLFSLFEKKLENLDRKVTEELAGINARLDSLLEADKGGFQRKARQLNKKHPSKGKSASKCYGCGEPGHLKLNCYRVKARIIRQEAGAQNGPPGAAHRAGRVKAHIAGKAHGASKNEDQGNRYNRDGTAHRSNQATRVVGSGQPTEADQGPAKDRPIPRATGKQDCQPSPRADPWKYGDGWSCAVNGCKWGGPKKTYLGLERHFARRHVPQRVEYVCPFGGYGCTKGVSQAAARNPDVKMARRHARRWHSEEAGLNEVIRSVPYVVVDNRDYVAPGDIPLYPSNPQGPGSRPFRDWPFLDDRAGPRWTVESVRDGYVSKEGKGWPKPYPGLQAREKNCTFGTVMTNIGKTLKAPQAFSGGPLIKSGKDNFQVGNRVSRWTGPYLVTEQLSDFVYKVRAAKGARPIEVHVDDLKVYDFRGEEEPSSWLREETCLTEHLQALAVKDGSSSISGVSMTPGDRPSDMNQEETKVVKVRIAPRARVEFPRSGYGDMPKTI